MAFLRKLIDWDTRFVRWLAVRLGLWRIDVILYLARALREDELAAHLEECGLPGSAAQVREMAAKWRGHARALIPACAPDAWRQAAA